MSKFTPLTDAIYDYIVNVSVRENPLLAKLREETAREPMARMQIAPDQGQFMAFLCHLIGARRTIEVGVFTGYSSLSVALALPDNGRIVALDVSEEWTAVARRYWAEAGVADKIDLRLGPALDSLDTLLSEEGEDRFDFAFIDADKENYSGYYERCLRLIRPGGIIAIDNVLWEGKVADPEARDADTEAIRTLNRALQGDERVELTLLSIADGLTLARKH
jgi:predicted O-methyltransferase YrrM